MAGFSCMLLALVCVTLSVESTEVLFPSGILYTAVDEVSLPDGVDQDVADSKSTGSLLYDADAENNNNRRLSLNFMVKEFRSPSKQYFRAHPTFMRCLQKIYAHLQDRDLYVSLVDGYKYNSEIAGSTKLQDVYATTGTGATLNFRQGVTGDIKDIAEAALMTCPIIFAELSRDLGVIMTGSGVHVHMTGPENSAPHFSVDGYSGMATPEFEQWAWNKLDAGLDLPKVPTCENFAALGANEVYPPGSASPEAVVGELDQRVTRDMEGDFKRLLQFMGTNIIFEGCDQKYTGNGPQNKCPNRLMAPRFYSKIVKLQKLARSTFSGAKLKVLEAWQEGDAGTGPGDALHQEARAMKLQLTAGNTAANMGKLSQLAVCLGMDYVHHRNDKIYVAVRKQESKDEKSVRFKTTSLLAVTPPISKQPPYKLSDVFRDSEVAAMPLFDSANRESKRLGEHGTVGMFKSKAAEFRYFRLNPAVVACYDAVHEYENKYHNDPVAIKVITGFMTTQEESLRIDPLTDERYNSHVLGVALHVTYDPSLNGGNLRDANQHFNLHRLAKVLVDMCAPVFHQEGEAMGIGLYGDGVFVDMRQEFTVWTQETSLLPEGQDLQAYEAFLGQRWLVTVEGRLVDPVDPKTACQRDIPPQKQSPDYRYRHSNYVQNLRRKRSAEPNVNADQCVPDSGTPFCGRTSPHRQAHIDDMWNEISLKYRYVQGPSIKDRLKATHSNCFSPCSTCMNGQAYEDKHEHCDNFLHWAPFPMMNDLCNDCTNFYSRSNLDLRKHACYGGEHCVDRAPLFSLVAETADALYRPDPNKSVKEELYDQTENPLPVLELIYDLYAIHAKGKVKVWVKDQTEAVSLKRPLKTAMLYNREVSEVEVYVSEDTEVQGVEGVIGNFINEWTVSGCPSNTREAIAPYTVQAMSAKAMKLAPEVNGIPELILAKHRNWEKEWLNKKL